MDMEFSDEQKGLQSTARSFLSTEAPLSMAREMETNEEGFSRDLWKKMADLGWLGLSHSEDVGGSAMGNVELVVLTKEMGRSLCPSPYIPTVILAGGAIAAAGSDEQKQRWLPSIISGETVLAFALQEENTFYDARSVHATAAPEGDGYVLNGTKMFVEFATAADKVLVVARTAGAQGDNDGLSMFLIDPNDVNVQMEPLNTVARDRQFQINLKGVKVAAADVIGEPGTAWASLEGVIEQGVVALCGYMVGASERIHEMATEFAKVRVQFGKPIAEFQAVQFQLAQMDTELEAARLMVYNAARTKDAGRPFLREAAMAKLYSSQVADRVTSQCVELFGGYGYSREYPVEKFYRDAKIGTIYEGTSNMQLQTIAKQLLRD